MWKNLTDDDKIPYNQSASDDKDRYHKEMVEFDPNYTVATSTSSSPKKTNAMILYQKEFGKNSWKNASDDDKNKFKNIAKEVNDENGFNA